MMGAPAQCVGGAHDNVGHARVNRMRLNGDGKRKKKPRPGGRAPETLGVWTLHERIDRGRGGHSFVYRVSREGDERMYALEYLRDGAGGSAAWERFSREVEACRKCRDIVGVLPLVDHHRPNDGRTGDKPWLVLGHAQPIDDVLGDDSSLEKVVEAIAAVASTLAEMHGRNISHRDIKPDNLFGTKVAAAWVIGDW